MFQPRYFAQRYFATRYFPSGDGGVVVGVGVGVFGDWLASPDRKEIVLCEMEPSYTLLGFTDAASSGGAVWPPRYFASRYFPPRYFASGGSGASSTASQAVPAAFTFGA